MKRNSWVPFLFFLLLLFFSPQLWSQSREKTIQIEWAKPVHFEISPDKTIHLLHFKGAVPSEQFPTLPSYNLTIELDNNYSKLEYRIKDIEMAPLTIEEAALIPTLFRPKELEIELHTASTRKKDYAVLSFIPIVFQSNTPQKITSIKIELIPSLPIMKKNYKGGGNSVLATGNWYKIETFQSGIHKVTYNDLISLGIKTTPLASSQIALFGNGGNMLPEANDENEFLELVENAIFIQDGGDGIFGPGDYFLFYGIGVHGWKYSPLTQQFNHQFNIYSNKTYYFITVDPEIGEKKRITSVNNSNLTPNITTNQFTHYDFYEYDKVNFAESGKIWVDEPYEAQSTKRYTFQTPTHNGEQARISIAAASNNSQASSFSIAVNGTHLAYMPLDKNTNTFAVYNAQSFSVGQFSSPLKIDLTFNKPYPSATVYLDYIEIQMGAMLNMYTSQFPFCNINTVGEQNITRFQIGNSNNATQVWDITNPYEPKNMVGELNNNQFSFNSGTSQLKYFFAFNGSQFYTVKPIGKISNQNLIGSSDVDLIIISHPNFRSEAERLAKFRKENDGLTSIIVAPSQVYNEFSSGKVDPSAIRNYMRAVYLKTNKVYPRYLLLVGRPSYDYRGIVEGTELYVPNYQTEPSFHDGSLGANDDYFALLDNNEGDSCRGLLDLGVGRFPVTTLSQAKICVDKSINYSASTNLTQNTPSLISNLGDWRNVVTFVGDNGDDNIHMITADAGAQKLAQNYPHFNIDKIYNDAYQVVSYAGGQRYPEVTKAINSRMNRGSLIFTYTGHGGGNGWSKARILEISDITKWKNKYNQPFMMNLTCSFGWVDRAAISPSELIYINEQGGAAAMMTTTRSAYTGANYSFCNKIFSNLLINPLNQPVTIGEFNMAAKNSLGGAMYGINMYVILGDPTMKLALPQHKIVTDSIIIDVTQQQTDTIKALDKVIVKGRITDHGGATLNQFNGTLFPSVYDKKINTVTLLNDPDNPPFEFEVQNSVLFRGNVSVINGNFEFNFVVPKDINYAYGPGKISYYARSSNSDAKGYTDQFYIGGFSDNPIVDENGPTIQIFLNDEKFVSGGICSPNPTLIIKLKDENGINTTGNGIGHDIVAIIDQQNDQQIILNDFYQTEKDSSNSGTIRYPLEELLVGDHTLKVRAWDIANNVSESSIDFTVVSDEKLHLEHVLNYPNPFTTHTSFFFEHNQAGETFDILVQIFTISGKLVKTISDTQHLLGNRSEKIDWNGLDDFGDKIAKGTYIYKLSVRNSKGEKVEKYEKLVIL
ncbi:MAG TPA: type IX secretion system sortase PorU [Bacteroidales bacterium]|nr:type IX secretion system sortase PorU [Bacteroidales bacterium]